MKLNWGNGIAFVYIAFVVLVGFMVYLTFGEKWDLVSEDYYEQEIKYQDKIDQKSAAIADEIKPQLSIDGKQLVVKIPTDEAMAQLSGTIHFFRPSDASKDFQMTLSGEQLEKIALDRFSKGKYTAKIEWEINGKKYYNEQTLIIP